MPEYGHDDEVKAVITVALDRISSHFYLDLDEKLDTDLCGKIQ